VNNFVGVGRICGEPDLRFIAGSGTAILKFTIAINRNMSKAKKDELKAQNKPTADFLRCQIWAKSAESLSELLTKGMLIAIKGSIQTGDYLDKDGKKVYTTDIKLDPFGGVEILEWAKKEEKNDFGMKAKDFEDDFNEIDDGCQIPFE